MKTREKELYSAINISNTYVRKTIGNDGIYYKILRAIDTPLWHQHIGFCSLIEEILEKQGVNQ